MNSIYTEYTNLTDEHKAWLDGCGATWASGHKFSEWKTTAPHLAYKLKEVFTQAGMEFYQNHDYTHIPTGDEFCIKVAEILGIDKPTFEQGIKMEDGAYTQDEIEKLLDSNHFVDTNKMVIYPHKTYRVLDSLDGIPLDTRIPLSEWIPPMGSEVAVISNKRMIGIVKAIKDNCVLLYAQGNRYEESITLDGHWMRIV